MQSDPHVEGLLAAVHHHVLVGANTASLKGFGTDLLVLVGDEVASVGEVIDVSALAAKIVDTDLGIGDTTAIPRLDVRLVLLVAVALVSAAGGVGWRQQR